MLVIGGDNRDVDLGKVLTNIIVDLKKLHSDRLKAQETIGA
jgi:hypothetical protein